MSILSFPFLSAEQQINTLPLPTTFATDWTGKFHSKGSSVLLPSSLKELSEIFAYCTANNLLICIQSGKTSLVGGSVPRFPEELILSLMHLPKEIGISIESDFSFTASANCTLAEINAQLEPHGRCVPIDLPAVASICTIGGCVATNAGGQRRIWWGTVRDNLLGLEVMLSSGKLLSLGQLEGQRKVSCGFELMHLLVGSEGTLAVATKVRMKSVTKLNERETEVKLQKFDSFTACVQAMLDLKRKWAGKVCLMEMWDSACLKAVELKEQRDIASEERLEAHQKKEATNKTPDSNENPAHEGQDESKSQQDLLSSKKVSFYLLSQIQEPQILSRPFVDSSGFRIRSKISTSISCLGPTLKYDLSFAPSQDYYTPLVQGLRKAFPNVQAFGYGHFGEGNLHLNVVLPDPPGFGSRIEAEIEQWVFDKVKELCGCPASEHGLGQAKAAIWKEKFACPVRLRLMEGVKKVFDPLGILNPGKIFDKATKNKNQ
jgi:FAD/FMN-containing dehydrogenase